MLSTDKFYKDTGLSNRYLDKEGAIGSDKCELIGSYFPDLNLEWLLTGKGSMFREVSPPGLDKDYKALQDKYIALLEELNEVRKQLS